MSSSVKAQKPKTLKGKYLLGEELGKGAHGKVYKGLDQETGMFVAVKEISLEKIAQGDLASITNEIELLKNLSHKNIVKYLGSIEGKTHLYILLELVENGSLANIIKPNKFGPFPEALVGVYLSQVLEGLVYLHDQDIIHCDIKGANILTTKDGIVKLADFGVAQRLSSGTPDARSEEDEHAVGTPYWMAPEVIEMAGVSPQSDIWSVGCTAIELLTTKPPYFDLQPMPALFRIVQDDMPPMPENVSAHAEDFLRLCFRRDVKARPDARALLKHPWIQGACQAQQSRRSSPSDRVPHLSPLGTPVPGSPTGRDSSGAWLGSGSQAGGTPAPGSPIHASRDEDAGEGSDSDYSRKLRQKIHLQSEDMKTLRAAARAARRQGQPPREDGTRLSQDSARLSRDASPALGSSARQGRTGLDSPAAPGPATGAARPTRFSGEFRLTGEGGGETRASSEALGAARPARFSGEFRLTGEGAGDTRASSEANSEGGPEGRDRVGQGVGEPPRPRSRRSRLSSAEDSSGAESVGERRRRTSTLNGPGPGPSAGAGAGAGDAGQAGEPSGEGGRVQRRKSRLDSSTSSLRSSGDRGRDADPGSEPLEGTLGAGPRSGYAEGVPGGRGSMDSDASYDISTGIFKSDGGVGGSISGTQEGPSRGGGLAAGALRPPAGSQRDRDRHRDREGERGRDRDSESERERERERGRRSGGGGNGSGSGGRMRLEVGEVIQVGDELLVVGAGGRLKVRRKKDKEKDKGEEGKGAAVDSAAEQTPATSPHGSRDRSASGLDSSAAGLDSSAQPGPPDWPKHLERPEDADVAQLLGLPPVHLGIPSPPGYAAGHAPASGCSTGGDAGEEETGWSEEGAREIVEQAAEMLALVAASVRGPETGERGGAEEERGGGREVGDRGRGGEKEREREGALRACRGLAALLQECPRVKPLLLQNHGVLPLTDALQFGNLSIKEASCAVLKALVASRRPNPPVSPPAPSSWCGGGSREQVHGRREEDAGAQDARKALLLAGIVPLLLSLLQPHNIGASLHALRLHAVQLLHLLLAPGTPESNAGGGAGAGAGEGGGGGGGECGDARGSQGASSQAGEDAARTLVACRGLTTLVACLEADYTLHAEFVHALLACLASLTAYPLPTPGCARDVADLLARAGVFPRLTHLMAAIVRTAGTPSSAPAGHPGGAPIGHEEGARSPPGNAGYPSSNPNTKSYSYTNSHDNSYSNSTGSSLSGLSTRSSSSSQASSSGGSAGSKSSGISSSGKIGNGTDGRGTAGRGSERGERGERGEESGHGLGLGPNAGPIYRRLAAASKRGLGIDSPSRSRHAAGSRGSGGAGAGMGAVLAAGAGVGPGAVGPQGAHSESEGRPPLRSRATKHATSSLSTTPSSSSPSAVASGHAPPPSSSSSRRSRSPFSLPGSELSSSSAPTSPAGPTTVTARDLECLDLAAQLLLWACQSCSPRLGSQHFLTLPVLRGLLDLLRLLPPRALAHSLALLRHLARDGAFGDLLQHADGVPQLVPLLAYFPPPSVSSLLSLSGGARPGGVLGGGVPVGVPGGEAVRLSTQVQAHDLLLLLALCKDNKRRQEAVLEAGGLPLLIGLAAGGSVGVGAPLGPGMPGAVAAGSGGVPGASPLQHLAIPLLCDLAQGSPRCRAQLAALGAPQLFLSLLAPPTVARAAPTPALEVSDDTLPVAPAVALSYEHSPLAYCLPQILESLVACVMASMVEEQSALRQGQGQGQGQRPRPGTVKGHSPLDPNAGSGAGGGSVFGCGPGGALAGEQLLLQKQSVSVLLNSFVAWAPVQLPQVLDAYLRLIVTFPRINAVLSVGGLASLVVARLDDPTLDSTSRLALLKILKVILEQHPYPPGLILPTDLPAKLQRLTEERRLPAMGMQRPGEGMGQQVLVKQMASALLKGLHFGPQ